MASLLMTVALDQPIYLRPRCIGTVKMAPLITRSMLEGEILQGIALTPGYLYKLFCIFVYTLFSLVELLSIYLC